MTLFDDDRPKVKIVHEIGQDLSLLSVSDLVERISILHAEIARLEADRDQKHKSKNAAHALFRS